MVLEEFKERIEVNPETGCWLWPSCDPSGYGRLWVRDGTRRGKKTYAHRHSFVLHFRPLKSGEVVHHRCAVRSCVNPEHLEAVSQSENVAESAMRRQFEVRLTKLEKLVAQLMEEKDERV